MVFLDDVFDDHDALVAAAHDVHPAALGGPSAVDLQAYVVPPRPPLVIDDGTAGLIEGPLVGLAMHG